MFNMNQTKKQKFTNTENAWHSMTLLTWVYKKKVSIMGKEVGILISKCSAWILILPTCEKLSLKDFFLTLEKIWVWHRY